MEKKLIYAITVTEADLLSSQLGGDLQRLTGSTSTTTAEIAAAAPPQMPSYDLIKWMELSAACAAQSVYGDKVLTRGHTLAFKPYAEARLNEELRVEVSITKHNRKLIYFDITVHAGATLIASMTHTRFVHQAVVPA